MSQQQTTSGSFTFSDRVQNLTFKKSSLSGEQKKHHHSITGNFTNAAETLWAYTEPICHNLVVCLEAY